MTLEEVSSKIKKLADNHAGRFAGKANFEFEFVYLLGVIEITKSEFAMNV